MKQLIRNIFSKIGLILVSEYDHRRTQKYIQLLEELAGARETKGNDCSIIIFSKDRAMQLDALLRSYFHFATVTPPVHVLYCASKEEFKKGYQELSTIYNDKKVIFQEENSFKEDLTRLFQEICTSKVLFLVDDIFFKNPVDFDKFTAIDPKKYVASLRMGKHLSFSYTLQQPQKLPVLSPSNEHKGLLSWSFDTAELDWAYPLSVDGHLFDSEEVRVMVNELEYKAPNSFEEALQLMSPLFKMRKGLCYPESVIVNNPCNKVQQENNNIAGDVTIEDLNEKWLSGYRIAFEKNKGLVNESAHQELTVEFVKR